MEDPEQLPSWGIPYPPTRDKLQTAADELLRSFSRRGEALSVEELALIGQAWADADQRANSR